MQRWWYMLGGLLIWAVHFVGVYAIASIGDVVAQADHPRWRMIGLGFSGVCVMVGLGLFIQALRRGRADDDVSALANVLAVSGAGIAVVAMIFQSLPTVVGY
jgi:hypothetical protein